MSDANIPGNSKSSATGDSWRIPRRGEHFISAVKQKFQQSEALESLSSSYTSGFNRFSTFLAVGCLAAIGIGFWGLSVGWTTYKSFQLRKSRYNKRIQLLERRHHHGQKLLVRLIAMEDNIIRPNTQEMVVKSIEAELEDLRLEISKNFPGISVDDYYEKRTGLLQHLDQQHRLDEWHKTVSVILRTFKIAVAEYLAELEDKQTLLAD